MPLKAGKSQKTFVSNIREMMHSYKRKGSIGTSTPANKKAAQKQILAIAYSKQREK
jgi:hypothetical protein